MEGEKISSGMQQFVKTDPLLKLRKVEANTCWAGYL